MVWTSSSSSSTKTVVRVDSALSDVASVEAELEMLGRNMSFPLVLRDKCTFTAVGRETANKRAWGIALGGTACAASSAITTLCGGWAFAGTLANSRGRWR